MRRSRRLTSVLILLAALVAGGLGAAGPADARPGYPSADDVRAAKRQAAALGDDVDAIQKRLDGAQAAADAAETAASQADEDYNVAVIELAQTKQAAKVAQAAADAAQKRVDGAQDEIGRLAADQYRQGGPIADLDVLLSPDGPDAVLERATMLQALAAERNRTVHAYDNSRVKATALQQEALAALEKQRQAAEQMAAARAAAQARSEAAANALAHTRADQQALIEQLAKARKTSVKLEKQRQAGLEAAARARAEAAARARAAAQARNNARNNDGGGNDGGGNDGGGNNGGGGGSSSGTAQGGRIAVAWAKTQLGKPYVWAAAGPNSYDCSGLVLRAWQKAGVYFPHSSRIQYAMTEHISYSSMRPGDLIFYATNTSNPGSIHHVTMYIGGGRMIEAPHTGSYVRIVSIRWGGAMPYAGRP
ncbi:NlpC/P60 family protein [Spongisporangium articulatum]|uniref:NlpC/P60 family protein n=1 Tax=Spongisporangium articulatum TaxID=3362603 RepID=A0ABW8ANH6_9ACTN